MSVRFRGQNNCLNVEQRNQFQAYRDSTLLLLLLLLLVFIAKTLIEYYRICIIVVAWTYWSDSEKPLKNGFDKLMLAKQIAT